MILKMDISSQQEIETTETKKTTKGYSIFTYYLTPNYDFIHDLLYFGDDVEVLEPLELRNCIALFIECLTSKYKQ